MKTILVLLAIVLLSGCCVYRTAYVELGDCQKCEDKKK